MQVPKGTFGKQQTLNLKNELIQLKRTTDKDFERTGMSNMARGTKMSSTQTSGTNWKGETQGGPLSPAQSTKNYKAGYKKSRIHDQNHKTL